MKKLLLLFMALLVLVSCSRSNDSYQIISNQMVDGYYIYELEHKGLFCNTYYEDIYYSGKTYNYGFSFKGCSPEMTFFILKNGQYIYLQDAIDKGYISLDSLIPELEKLERHPEEISTDDADYYWLDFHINHEVVYAYAGGECDQHGSETFVINGINYYYNADGCLQNHILYMKGEGDKGFIPVSELLSEGLINGEYLIPLLTEDSN